MKGNKMAVTYEWCAEDVDRETGDILDHNFQDRLSCISELNYNQDLCLVRTVGSDLEGITDRDWAYVVDGLLPDFCAYGAKVPKIFKLELSRSRPGRFCAEPCRGASEALDRGPMAAPPKRSRTGNDRVQPPIRSSHRR